MTASLCRGVRDLQFFLGHNSSVASSSELSRTLLSPPPGTQSLNLLQSQCQTPRLPRASVCQVGSQSSQELHPDRAGTAAAPQQRGFVKCQATPPDTEAFKPSSASCYPLLTASARELENRTTHLLSCCSVQLPQQWLQSFLSQRLQVNASVVTSTGLEMLPWHS